MSDVAPPSGKYLPLYRELERLAVNRWDATFADVEGVLGFRLPDSARDHPAWWGNETGAKTHSHARAWLAAGFETSQVRLDTERVTFRRVR